MKKLNLTKEDRALYEQFKEDNPALFDAQDKDYSKQIAKMRRDDPADADLLAGKKLQDFYQTSYKGAGRELSADQVQHAKDYYKKVVTPGTKKNLTYQDADRIIHSMISTYEQNEQMTYQWDASNKKVIDDLLRYFMNDHQGPLATRKWIWLYGEMGTGKSFIANLFSNFTRAYGIAKRFEVVSAEDIAEQVKREKSTDGLIQYTDNICIDDAGEESAVKVYGEQIDVIEHIMRKAYNKYHKSRSNKPTIIITSNLAPAAMVDKLKQITQQKIDMARKQNKSAKEIDAIKRSAIRLYSIESRYKSERTLDRIYEMFNFIPLLGKNKRV